MRTSPSTGPGTPHSGGSGRALFDQERSDAVNQGTSLAASSKLLRPASFQAIAREEGQWAARSPRAVEVYNAGKADLADSAGGSPIKLKACGSSSRGSSPARWKNAAGALSPVPGILQGSGSAAYSPTPSLQRLMSSKEHSSMNSRFGDEDALHCALTAQPAQLHLHPSQQQQQVTAASGASTVSALVQQLSASRGLGSSNGSPGIQPAFAVRDAAGTDSPGRPRRTISAPGSQLHTIALQHATMQQQQQHAGIGGETSSPRPNRNSSLAARLGDNPSYSKLSLLDVTASQDGHHGLGGSCDTPDSNGSGYSLCSAAPESPYQQHGVPTRFKPRPPGGSGSSAGSTPHSNSAFSSAGGVVSMPSIGSSSSSGGGGGASGASLQPHPPPPQSCRKASKPTTVSGLPMLSVQECGSPQLHRSSSSFGERLSDSPVPGSGSLDQSGGSGMMRRGRTYYQQKLNRGSNSGACAVDVGSNPNSPSGMARTPSSGGGIGGFSSLMKQDSGSLPDLVHPGGGSTSPYGSNGATGAAAIIGGAFVGSGSSGAQAMMMSGSSSGSSIAAGQRHLAGPLAASPLGSSAGATNGSSSSSGAMGPPPPLPVSGSGSSFSRPGSGKGKTVCVLVDAVRSRDDSQLDATLAYCHGGVYLNDKHPIYDRTALHEAVCLGSVSMVRMLLARGSDANIGHHKEGGPLLQAAAVGATDIVELLLDAGAHLEGQDVQGRTALHHACRSGHVETAWKLILRGADQVARTVDGETPFDLAREDVADILQAQLAAMSLNGGQQQQQQQQQPQPAAGSSLPGTPGSRDSHQHLSSTFALSRHSSSSGIGAAGHESTGLSNGGDGAAPPAPHAVMSRTSSAGGSTAAGTPVATPGGSVLGSSGSSFTRRASSSGGGHGHSSSGGGGLLSQIGSAAGTGAVNSPSSGPLPSPPLSGSVFGGGTGTPPISPSSLADAGPASGGMRRPSPPITQPSGGVVAGGGSAVGGGSSAGSRWGRLSALGSMEGSGSAGESSSHTPLDQLPEERAPTPPVLRLPDRLANVRKQRLRSKVGSGLEDIQRGLSEDDQSFMPVGQEAPNSSNDEAGRQAVQVTLRDLVPSAVPSAAAGGTVVTPPSNSSSSSSNNAAGGFGSFTGYSDLSRLSAPPATGQQASGLDFAAPGFRSPLGSSSGSARQHTSYQQQGKVPLQLPALQQQQQPAAAPVFKFGIDPKESVQQQQQQQHAATAAPSQQQQAGQQQHAAASPFKFGVDPRDAALAPKPQQQNQQHHFAADTFKLRSSDSIPRQLAAAASQAGQQQAQGQQQQQQQSDEDQQTLQRQSRLAWDSDTRIPPLLQDQSPPSTPEGPNKAAGPGQQRNDHLQVFQATQGGGGGVGPPLPLLSGDGGRGSCGSSSEALGAQAARMFGHSVDLQTGNIEWKCGELLGEGAYGKVFAGLNQRTGELMAVKALQLVGRSGSAEVLSQLQELTQELDIYKKLKHNHIVGYIDHRFDKASATLYIFLEYVPGGSIASMLQRFGQFSEEVTRMYTRQLLLGLEYLHAQQIVHRDVKGGNALLTQNGIVKLADFGASKPFSDGAATDAMKSLKGSAFWMAPEILRGCGYGRKADIWSLGCTVLEMLTGKHPWPDLDNQWSAMVAITQTTSGPPRPTNISTLANDFLNHCFKVEAKERCSATELLQHPWVAPGNSTRTRAALSDDV